MYKRTTAVLLASLLVLADARADVFGTGSNTFSIAFVEIGHPGNAGHAADTNRVDLGAVNYRYRMADREISVDQFSKALSADSRIGNGNEIYWNDGVRTVGPGAPVSYCTWYEAARFANWLTSGDAYAGAYQFDTNGVLTAVDRDAAMAAYGIVYVLPTEDEWYKCAFYMPQDDGSYSLFSDGTLTFPQDPPIQGTTNGFNYSSTWDTNGAIYFPGPNYMWESGYGAMEQNGTYDMCGNVWEWSESAGDGLLDDLTEGRVIRNGSALDKVDVMRCTFRHNPYDPANEHQLVGFRVASVPVGLYRLETAVVGGGTLNVSDSWQTPGTNLILVATPDPGWLFTGWSGDLTGDYTAESTNLVMDSSKSITATFSDDADGDGLSNDLEATLGTSPRDPDSDDDLISDGEELALGLDPLVSNAGVDRDGDGLLDADEVNLYGTHPLNPDTDADAMPDGWEVAFALDPLVTNALADADADGGADLYEFALGGNPTNGSDIGWIPEYGVAQVGGTNWLEYIHARRTNAGFLGLSYAMEWTEDPVSGPWTNGGYSLAGSTDLGGGFEALTNRLNDPVFTNLYLRLAVSAGSSTVYSSILEVTPFEVWAGGFGLYGTNALAAADPDMDGLSNAGERTAGTHPLDADSDDDAMPDGWEVSYALDPLIANATVDTDSDGETDLYEFSVGGNPRSGLDIGLLPGYRITQVDGTNRVEYTYAQRTNALSLGLSYAMEWTQNPGTGPWLTNGYSQVGLLNLGNGFEEVTSRMHDGVTTNLFIRLAITAGSNSVYSTVLELTPEKVWAGGFGLYGANALGTADPDADGLSNTTEFGLGTSPVDSDSDDDDLSDGDEVIVHATDPLNGDTDGDTFGDGLEAAHGGNPLVSDLWRIEHIRNHGSEYDLYSSNDVLDISVGQAGFLVSNETAWLSLQLEESSDLITWTNAGDAVIWSIPVDLTNGFYRIRSGR